MTVRIKRTFGKTWAKLNDGDFFDEKFLGRVGDMLVDAIVFEAGKDFAKQGNSPTPRGEAEGIPRSLRFFDSFGHKIVKGTQVEIFCTWPWIEQIVQGRPPYPMTWLTHQAGISKWGIRQSDQKVLIKTTPLGSQDAWIHPGFRKHTFVRRGYDRARRQMKSLLNERVAKVLSNTPVA